MIELSDLPDYVRTRSRAARRERRRAPRCRRGAARSSLQPNAPAPTPPRSCSARASTFKDAKERWVATFERDYILQLLRRNNGNISHAARDADIDRKYFRKLMKKYDIEAAGCRRR